jgi:hypothetical protein
MRSTTRSGPRTPLPIGPKRKVSSIIVHSFRITTSRAVFERTRRGRVDATPVIRSFRDLFLRRKQGGQVSESVSSLLDPTLSLLGFHAVAVRRDAADGTKADYELFAEAGDETPIALALTYPWERYLDGKDETRDPLTPNENPGSAVVSLLQNRA